MHVLEHLNDAYLSVRYENNYEIGTDDLECLLAKAHELDLLLTKRCSEMIDHYKNNRAINMSDSD